MNDPDLMPDDPQLTAYALGELDGDERATVEAAVRANPQLRQAVDDIRATAFQIQSALAAEAAIPLQAESEPTELPLRPLAPVVAGKFRHGDKDTYATPRGVGRFIRFPQLYYIAGGLAAACFALMVALNRDEYQAREQARSEAMRLAYEKRAAENRTLAAERGTLISVPAPDSNGVVSTDGLGTASVSPTATEETPDFMPEDLGLLRQIQPPLWSTGSRNTSVRERISAARNRRGTASSTAPAPTASGASAPNPTPATPSPANSQPVVVTTPTQLDYVPSTRNLDAANAPAGGTDLFPGPSRVFAPPARTANVTANGSRTPAPNPDVIVLDAFEVTGERTSAAYAMSAARSSANQRGYDPDFEAYGYRPRAPAGARFGRSPAAEVRDNEFLRAIFNPLSTFAIETDATSYVNVRRSIARGEMPPREMVKIEELLNYFPYRYAVPPAPRSLSFLQRLGGEDGSPPFAASLEVAEAPWAPKHRLVRIGLKGRELDASERPAANLVFLIDVSASMNEPNRLPLVKEALRLLLTKLRPDDRIAIVTYGGNAGLVLGSTRVGSTREIAAAIDSLTPADAAHGAPVIRLAYDVARQSFAEDGINRVILCTDGDFNLGAATETELMRLVSEKAANGVFLTVLGFGMGNYKDQTLESLAQRGNGSFGYIDSRREAQKLLVEEISSTLVTIAKDVKIQVEFNPARVSSYRLIGYENRLLRKEDFNADHVDGGEIGAGHCVTALYEVVPVGAESPVVSAEARRDDLRYVKYAADDAFSSRLAMPSRGNEVSNELLHVTVRYKKPDGMFSRMSEFPLIDSGATFAKASADFRFAAAVAQFGMILRKSSHKGNATIGDVIAWAAGAAANPVDDPGGYRGEFIDLARQAQEILRTE